MEDLECDPQVNNVLRLLTFVIVADAKIYQKEIDAFLAAADGLDMSDRDGKRLSRTWLFEWFLQYCENIRAESTLPNVDTKLVKLFVRLQSWPTKQQLLAALCKVAAADGHFHINEKVLIALAAAYWGQSTPEMNNSD
jgi:uncharacterized tellurite resistance protein B-like protein